MMKNTLFTFLLILLFSQAFSQNYYEDTYTQLKDDNYYPKIDAFLGTGDYDSVVNLAEPAFDYYFKRGETDRAIYLFNVCMYFPTAMGLYDVTMPEMIKKIDFLSQKIDTLNVHYATTLHILAFGYKYYNELDAAIPYFERAIAIYEQIETPTLHLCSIYQSYAPFFIYSGDFKPGYAMYQKALQAYYADTTTSTSFLWKKNHDIATVQMGIALAMEETNQIGFSYFFNKKALQNFIDYYPESSNAIVTAVNLSGDCNKLKYFDEADYYANWADSVFKANYSVDELFMVYYYVLLESGTAKTNLGDFDAADRIFRELLALTDVYFQGDNFSCSAPYLKIAENYYTRNLTDSALVYYQKAIDYLPQSIDYQIDIAKVYNRRNENPEAIGHLQNALSFLVDDQENETLSIKIPFSKDIVDDYKGFQITSLLADYFLQIALEENNSEYLDLSVSYSMLADTLIINQIATTLTGGNDDVIAEEYHKFASVAINASYRLWLQTNKPEYLNNILNFISQSKSVKLNTETNNNGLTESQLQIFKDIKKTENILQAATNSEDKALINKTKESLFELNLKSFELSMDLQENGNLSESSEANRISTNQIQSLLTEQEAIIAYHFADSILYIIMISKDAASLISSPIDDRFSSTISDFYRQIKTGDKNFTYTSAELYSYLLKPFDKQLAGIEKLVIIPDRELNQIPFEALVYDANIKNGFLINQYEVSYNFSVDLWQKGNAKSTGYYSKDYSFLGFAPVFGKDLPDIEMSNPIAYDSELRSSYSDILDASKLKPLPQSKVEVAEVQKLFVKKGMNSEIFTFEQATEKNLVENISKYKILHFATHGYSSTTNPELSGLFMFDLKNSDKTDITDDGFLYAGEIYNMDLNADLVVLSACKSGSGKIVQGEGSMSLPRVFAFNGVPNVIASLWKIHDTKTKDLMLCFYENILAGKSYSQSLRLAKLKQIKAGELPMDWASMVLIGL